MNSVNDIRRCFLDFFAKHGHSIVASSPLIPDNDPSLLFTNSGMVQFKNIFTGNQSPEQLKLDKLVVSSQKCLRAGGKHNDLDNVGYTSRHHTFFEMLGNFSFGEYFKEYAIELAWKLLTVDFGLPKSRLLVTVYHDDDDSFNYWHKIANLPKDKIIRIASNDNFWRMGDVGPCGPCSEIFFDHGDKIAGGLPGSALQDGDRFVEIWNLVFMQYEEKLNGQRSDLPKPSIDTGMGLERIATVLQGHHDNYETDMFKTLINASIDIIGGKEMIGHRVISDHLRAVCFLLSEGLMPSNEGRGYVLRRIMRRAMRYAHKLGAKDEPVIYKLVPTLTNLMGEAYPQLIQNQTNIIETIKREEERFGKTLDNGLLILEKQSENLKKGDELPGDIAFRMYDTYGFPFDLTEDILRSRDITVDKKGFDRAMQKQKIQNRKKWIFPQNNSENQLYFELAKKIPPTEFLGYNKNQLQAKITAIIVDGEIVQKVNPGQKAIIITNQTVFYAEAGGQVGDQGTIKNKNNAVFQVLDTQKPLGTIYAHYGICENAPITKEDEVYLSIDTKRRNEICCHHSATHLIHAALRHVLGEHVMQKGSKVSNEYLRFDFSQPTQLTQKQLIEVENLVNQKIRENHIVVSQTMQLDEARKTGAMALFGEKYGEEVRVVSIQNQIQNQNNQNDKFSIELCGGTHVKQTGDIGLIKIFADTSISADVRRIEAKAGENAVKFLQEQNEQYQIAAKLLNSPPSKLVERIKIYKKENLKLQNQVEKLKKQIALGTKDKNENIEKINNVYFIGKVVTDIKPKDARQYIDQLKTQYQQVVAVIAVILENGGVALSVGISNNLTDTISAIDLVNQISTLIGGKGGGGRKDLAHSGGTNSDMAQNAIDNIKLKCRQIFENRK